VATITPGVIVATAQTARAQAGFLQWMGRWNERVERFLFRPERLGAEVPPAETTPDDAFPSY